MRKSSGESSVRRPVPQPHGGALVPGAGGGPQPGAGRPPADIRFRLRGSLADRLHVLTDIADDREARPADRIRAVEVLLRYSLGADQGVPVEDVRRRLAATIQVVRQELPPNVADHLLARMETVWR